MAISAKIDKSRFGTAHAAAYIKVADVANDYINGKGVTILHIYNSVEDYLDGAQCLYKERIESSLEEIEESWGTHAEPSDARQLAYRIGRNELAKKSDYSTIVNVFDHGFEGSGQLSENEIIELKEREAKVYHLEEEEKELSMRIEKSKAFISDVTKEKNSLVSVKEKLESDIASAEKSIETAKDEVKTVKEAIEKADEGSAERAAAEKDLADKMVALERLEENRKSTHAELAEAIANVDRLEEDLTREKAELDETEDSKGEIDGKLKEETELRNSLISKDLQGKLIENSLQKEREEKELEKLKQEKAALVAEVMKKAVAS